MIRRQRVLWTEGMPLSPHHMQQMVGFLESEGIARHRMLNPYSWGVLDFGIDAAGLRGQMVKLTGLRALLPDGTYLDCSQGEFLPTECPITARADVQKLHLWIGLPVQRLDTSSIRLLDSDSSGLDSRYIESRRGIADETYPSREEDVSFAALNLRLMLSEGREPESRVGPSLLRLAVLERGASGIFQVSESYVPPALSMRVAAPVSVLVDSLLSQISSIVSRLRSKQALRLVQRELSPQDLLAVLQLFALSGSLAQLQWLDSLPSTTPARYFEVLTELLGKLSTFEGTSSAVVSAPIYRHDDIYESFFEMANRLKPLLDVKLKDGYQSIEMVKRSRGRWECDIPQALPSESQFLLIARGAIQDRLRRLVKDVGKLGATNQIDVIQRNQLEGVPLVDVRPPNSVPHYDDAMYFKIAVSTPRWEEAIQLGSVAFLLPELAGVSAGLDFTLMAIFS